MGLVGLMNSLAIEGEKYGIRVNTVAPLAASRLTEDVLPPDLQGKCRPRVRGAPGAVPVQRPLHQTRARSSTPAWAISTGRPW